MSNQTMRQRISDNVNPSNKNDIAFIEVQNESRSNKLDEQSNPGYLSQYGLREAAFSSVIDDRFFFLDANHAQRLNQIHNLIQDPNLFLHISGVSGVGKSSLINRFINIGEEDWRFSYFSANTMMNSEQLYFNISAGFGLSGIPDKDSNIRDNCINNIAMLEKSGVIPILIIDDVHELAIESLKSVFDLVNRWDKNHPNLRVIMISNPQFESTLASEHILKIRHTISHFMGIGSLNEEQIEQYIYYRLSVAGLDGGNPITLKACKTILAKSKGIPKNINRLCHLALRDGMDEMTMKDFFDEHNFSFPFRKYLISGAVIAIFLGFFINIFDSNQTLIDSKNTIVKTSDTSLAISDSSLFSYFPDSELVSVKINDVFHIQDENDSNLQATVSPSILNEKLDNHFKIYNFTKLQLNYNKRILSRNSNIVSNITKLQLIENNLKNNSDQSIFNRTLKVNKVVSVNAVTEKNDSNKLASIGNGKYPLISSINPTSIKTGPVHQTVHIIGEDFSKNSSVIIYRTGGSSVLAKNKIKFHSDKHLEISITVGKIAGKHWIVITHPKNGKSNGFLINAVKPVIISSQETKFVKDEKWMLGQNSDYYILYLRGSKIKQEIISFASRGRLDGQYAMFKTNRHGTDWYHLVIGVYESKESAKIAIESFPNQVTKPWIRSIRDIQRAIRYIKI